LAEEQQIAREQTLEWTRGAKIDSDDERERKPKKAQKPKQEGGSGDEAMETKKETTRQGRKQTIRAKRMRLHFSVMKKLEIKLCLRFVSEPLHGPLIMPDTSCSHMPPQKLVYIVGPHLHVISQVIEWHMHQ